MKKHLLVLALMLLPLYALADAVEIDGIYYNLIEKAKVAEVTGHPNGYTGDVVIPEKVKYNEEDYYVTVIEQHAFFYCSGLTSVTIPNSVTSIGKDAFMGSNHLTSVHISDLSAWCKISFSSSSSNPCSLAHRLLLNGDEVTSIVIPDDITEINTFAFSGCSYLTSVIIPNGVTSIGDLAFYNCINLASVTIPNSIISIGNSAFTGCYSLTSVTIPDSVSLIGFTSVH